MKGPLTYYGGKQKLADTLINLFPKHNQYVEIFVGGGSVFWKKPKSEHEVINDFDGNITNFYYIVKTKFNELKEMIDATLHSEVHYRKANQILNKEIEASNVERAWAIWVALTFSFSSIIGGGYAFGNTNNLVKRTTHKKSDFTNLLEKKLQNVEIFNRDALDMIKLKDTPYTFFYCDPPYVSSDQGHYDGYTMNDFKNLLDALTNIKGKFLLSSYPEDILMEYRKKYKWKSKDLKQVVSVTGKREETKYKIECITWNYNDDNELF